MLGFAMPKKARSLAMAVTVLACVWATGYGAARQPPVQSLRERILSLTKTSNGAWTAEQIAAMSRLRDAAMTDKYALNWPTAKLD